MNFIFNPTLDALLAAILIAVGVEVKHAEVQLALEAVGAVIALIGLVRGVLDRNLR
jgi:hypothetical protein